MPTGPTGCHSWRWLPIKGRIYFGCNTELNLRPCEAVDILEVLVWWSLIPKVPEVPTVGVSGFFWRGLLHDHSTTPEPLLESLHSCGFRTSFPS